MMRINILYAFEKIFGLAEKSNLALPFFAAIKQCTDYLGRKLDITPVQSVLLAVILNGVRDEYVSLSCISQHLGCANIRLLQLQDDLDSLERRRILVCNRGSEDYKYRVPHDVLQAFNRDEPFVPEPIAGLSTDMMLAKLDDLYNQRRNNDMTFEMLVERERDMVEANPQLAVCREVKRLNLDNDSLALLLFFVVRMLTYDVRTVNPSQFREVFKDKHLRSVRRKFLNDSHPLLKDGILEATSCCGDSHEKEWRLRADVSHKLLADYPVPHAAEPTDDATLQLASAIPAKTLYYNAPVQKQVRELETLFEQDNYLKVRNTLQSQGLRKGFNCLFYGAPGTGKTETALQLARISGRDIMEVDFHKVRDSWVGESEKNVKAIFDHYRDLVDKREVTPILLLNEADALFGTRIAHSHSSVDKMENTMVNIVLTQMEGLDGILIATTNLMPSFDPAFERRFLFKIQFDQPCPEARSQIWQSLLPGLKPAQARALARKYCFSGGQIENVVRKKFIDDVLTGREGIDMAVLEQYCTNELFNRSTQIPHVGF